MDYASWIICGALIFIAFALVDDICKFGLLDKFIKTYDRIIGGE